MNNRIIDAISSPADLKVLTDEELSLLANEIREEIVSVTSETGGHVASSLGAVEIILAAHAVLDCPHDKLIFDVGHQAYAHKLVTGRLNSFSTLRCDGGISGFPKPTESPYDVHPSGHASDSLSVALGLAKARDLRGTHEHIMTVIGDASLSGGMAFEALNHIGQDQTPMVIILNDNEMSISHNVGALMNHLGHMRASAEYRTTRDAITEKLEKQGRLGSALAQFSRSAKDSMKQFILPHTMMFEQLGIICTAPIDGHDIGLLREMLASVLDVSAPVLVHVVTKKGIGYTPAERSPELFHGISPYNVDTGEVKKSEGRPPAYTSIFGDALVKEAQDDESIVAITAAMCAGTGLSEFAQKFPHRFFDAGIAEEHAAGLASGLAFGGLKPVVAIYSTFLQRAIDQLIINNALSNLDVVFCIDRAGLVGEDGPTHHGMFDIVYTRMVPHLRVIAPSNEAELVNALHTALHEGGPFVIRYPRGEAQGVPLPENPHVLETGKSSLVREGSDVAILAFGRMVAFAMDAADILAQEGIEARVVDMRWVKPLDEDAIRQAAQLPLMVTVEEGVVAGGVGEGVLDVIANSGLQVPSMVLGIHDEFVNQGKIDTLLHDLGLDGQGIALAIKAKLG